MDSIIIKYLEGTASEKEIRALKDWLEERVENKKCFCNYAQLWYSSQASLSDTRSTEEAFQRFKIKVLDFEKKVAQRRHSFHRWKVAASIALAIVCSAAGYFLGSRSSEAGSRPEEKAVVLNQTSIRNTKSSIQLPDGSVVWLNQGSQLTYPSSFASNERTVKLEGEAFFEVVRNENTPFFVETQDMTIKVLGTSFSVKNDKKNTLAEAVLVSGKVEVHFTNENTPVLLYPNQKISYKREESAYVVEDVDASEYTLWKNDRLVMTNESLTTIFRKMERWYGIEIVCEGALPLQSKFSITITDEPKEEILRLLSITHPIGFTIENKKVIVRGK